MSKLSGRFLRLLQITLAGCLPLSAIAQTSQPCTTTDYTPSTVTSPIGTATGADTASLSVDTNFDLSPPYGLWAVQTVATASGTHSFNVGNPYRAVIAAGLDPTEIFQTCNGQFLTGATGNGYNGTFSVQQVTPAFSWNTTVTVQAPGNGMIDITQSSTSNTVPASLVWPFYAWCNVLGSLPNDQFTETYNITSGAWTFTESGGYCALLNAPDNFIQNQHNGPGDGHQAETWNSNASGTLGFNGDSVQFQNVSANQDVGFYVSGDLSCSGTNCSSDPYQTRRTYAPAVPSSGVISLGSDNFTPDSTRVNQVVAFTIGKSPVIGNATWTTGKDTPVLSFQNQATLPIVFWNLASSPNQQEAIVSTNLVSTYAYYLYLAQKVGIAVPTIPTITPTAQSWSNIQDCSTLKSSPSTYVTTTASPSGNVVPIKRDAINVYIVDELGKAGGLDCGGGIVLLRYDAATFTGLATLAHELGHELSLWHVMCNPAGSAGCGDSSGGDAAGFDERNLMAPWFAVGTDFSALEISAGQIYRMNFTRDSALNGGIGVSGPDEINDGVEAFPSVWSSPKSISVQCPPVAASTAPQANNATCPALCKRLWSSPDPTDQYPACSED